MITPNKTIPLEDSALGHARLVLEELSSPLSVRVLQEKTSGRFESIDQFILTMDLLFVLGRICVDFQTGRVASVT